MFMVIAGEPSGDTLAAELVRSLRATWAEKAARPSADLQPLETGLAPRFFGAGGARMAEYRRCQGLRFHLRCRGVAQRRSRCQLLGSEQIECVLQQTAHGEAV